MKSRWFATGSLRFRATTKSRGPTLRSPDCSYEQWPSASIPWKCRDRALTTTRNGLYRAGHGTNQQRRLRQHQHLSPLGMPVRLRRRRRHFSHPLQPIPRMCRRRRQLQWRHLHRHHLRRRFRLRLWVWRRLLRRRFRLRLVPGRNLNLGRHPASPDIQHRPESSRPRPAHLLNHRAALGPGRSSGSSSAYCSSPLVSRPSWLPKDSRVSHW